MDANTLSVFISPMLMYGKENATSTLYLMHKTGLSERALRRQIHAEREAGELIISCKGNGGGYYLPSTEAEAADFVRFMQIEAKSHFSATAAAKKYVETVKGQESLKL